ncbi:MAG: beta-ketoacyl synthase N-terminal-like domain-containing protein, partial [Myxococcota bacterium]|nr:beta-ketoacyl synthase N-terminal-like domain-containing protein [Myxococcota bacterium]
MGRQERSDNGGIAVVGMGCRFAGAQDLQGYWEMIVEGRDGFGPVPDDRWDFEAFYDANPRAIDKSYAPAGGFIDDVRSFPAIALQIPPRRVEVMDPQQRLSLEICLSAVEDAGYDADTIPTQTGVYMGVTAMEYRTLISARLTAQLMATGALRSWHADWLVLDAPPGGMVPHLVDHLARWKWGVRVEERMLSELG